MNRFYFLCGICARWTGQSQGKLEPSSGSHQTAQADSGALFQLRHFQKIPKPGCFGPDVPRDSSVSCAFLQQWKLEGETSVLGYWWTLKILGRAQILSLGKSISKDPATEICHLTRERLSMSNVQELYRLHCPYCSIPWRVFSQVVHQNLQSTWTVCVRSKDSKNLHYSTHDRHDSLKHCGKYQLLNSFLLLSHSIPFFTHRHCWATILCAVWRHIWIPASWISL